MENKKRKLSGLILTGSALAGMANTAATTTSAGFIDFTKKLAASKLIRNKSGKSQNQCSYFTVFAEKITVKYDDQHASELKDTVFSLFRN